MPWRIITRYTFSALMFALACVGLWLCIRRAIMKRPFDRREALRLATLMYLAAVMQIIALRFGLRPIRPLNGALRLIPLKTTLAEWRKGPGAFVYHIAGNLIWFVPLGALMTRLKPESGLRHALLAGATLSLTAETLQYLLGTGISDMDDWLLNICGAGLGWLIGHHFFPIHKKTKTTP